VSRPLASAHQLALEFRMMPDTHEPNHLGARFNAAVSSELRILAHGPRRDYDAVLPTIPFRWSNGQVEGQVSRLKLVKRTMYGRASFQLLRRCVLASSVATGIWTSSCDRSRNSTQEPCSTRADSQRRLTFNGDVVAHGDHAAHYAEARHASGCGDGSHGARRAMRTRTERSRTMRSG
jgi:hypothetical protein